MDNISAKAGRFFEDYAHQFDSIYDTQHESGIIGWLTRKLRASMSLRYEGTFKSLEPMEGQSVIDIGCGSGRYMVTCLALGASKVLGLDLSREMLAMSKDAVDAMGTGYGPAEYICDDFLTYRVEDTFNYGIVMGVMDYIASPGEFLEKLSSVVTEKAVLSFPARESIWTPQRKIRYALRGCPLYLYSHSKLDDLMKQSRFATYRIEKIARDYFVVAST